MRYYFDCEFIEDGKTIELISIGIVAEDGREYYAINSECNFRKASKWVKDNVLNTLPPRRVTPQDSPRIQEESRAWKRKEVIAIEVMAFLKNLPTQDLYCFERSWLAKLTAKWFGTSGMKDHPSPKVQDIFLEFNYEHPEIWAYYADYDHVALCQLFGTMMDLPEGFPMYCRDIKQECDRLGNPQLPKQENGQHHALEDARHNRVMFEFLKTLEQQKT